MSYPVSDPTWKAGFIVGIGDCVFEHRCMEEDQKTGVVVESMERKTRTQVRHLCKLTVQQDPRDRDHVMVVPVEWLCAKIGAVQRDGWFDIDPARIGPVGNALDDVIKAARETVGDVVIEEAKGDASAIFAAARAAALEEVKKRNRQ